MTFKKFIVNIKKTNSLNKKKQIIKDFNNESNNLACRLFNNTYSSFKKYNLTSKNIEIKDGSKNITDIDISKYLSLLDKIEKGKINRGNDSKEAIENFISKFKKEDAKLLLNILDRDLDIGINVKTINKALKNKNKECIPTFNVQLANDLTLNKKYINNQLPFKNTYISRKMDGGRLICIKRNDDVDCFTRKGFQRDNQLPEIIDSLENEIDIDNVVFDGEIAVVDKNGNENFKLTSSLLNSKKQETLKNKRKKINKKGKLVYFIFDLITLNAFKNKKGKIKYKNKYKNINKNDLTSNHTTLLSNKKINNFKQLNDKFNESKELNWEGLVLRDGDSVYEGKRTSKLLKLKQKRDKEYKIIGFEEGEKSISGKLGSIIIKHKGSKVNVGSGFTIKEREDIWDNRKKLLGKYITVEFLEESIDKDGNFSLRNPVFKSFRSKGKEMI